MHPCPETGFVILGYKYLALTSVFRRLLFRAFCCSFQHPLRRKSHVRTRPIAIAPRGIAKSVRNCPAQRLLRSGSLTYDDASSRALWIPYMNSPGPIGRNNVNLCGNPRAGETMVFVHGFGTDQTAWSDVAAAFHAGYKIVLLDNASCGGSDQQAFERNSNRYVTLRGYAADVVEVGVALGLKDAILVGHSVGGMIATLASIERPDLYSKLVLLGASPRYLNDLEYHGGFTQDMIGAIHLQMYRNYYGWTQSFARQALGDSGKPHLVEYYARHLDSIPFTRAASTLITILESDHRKDLMHVSVPTLIVQSKDDFAIPLEVARYLRDHISGSRLSVIDASGHLPHVSAPDAVVAAIKDFLESAAPTSQAGKLDA